MDDLLNVELVKRLRREHGYTIAGLIDFVDLGRTTGYLMFRKGLLPEDRAVRAQVLAKLAKRLGTTELALVVPFVAKVTA